MSKLVRMLVEGTGLSEQQARQVARFLSAHADQVPLWLDDHLPDTVRPPALTAPSIAARVAREGKS